jgi:hypothetical protein
MYLNSPYVQTLKFIYHDAINLIFIFLFFIIVVLGGDTL